MFHAAEPLRVFLADDSSLMLDRVAALLAHRDIQVIGRARTPARSIDAILADRPQVVVLDVQLEGGNGLEVLRAVRAAAPEIAFIVFSNNSGPAYRKRYLAAGAVEFLDKSTEFGQLAAAVARTPRAAAD
jgi:DNA-binding NarL/FixJ family response regulator